MKLALLNEFFYPDQFGGTGKVLSDLARRLQDAHGWDVTAITTARSYRGTGQKLEAVEDWDGIKIHRIPIEAGERSDLSNRLKTDLAFTFAVEKELNRLGPFDAVLVTTAPPFLPMAAQRYGRRTKTPYTYIIYDLEPDRAAAVGVSAKGNWKHRLLRHAQNKWLHGSHRVIAIGRCMKDHLMAEYGLPASQIDVITVGEDHQAVQPLPRGGMFREGLEDRELLVLYSGNFGRYHDFEPLLQAGKILEDAGDPVRLMLVGGGHKKDEIAARVKELGLNKTEVRSFVDPEEYPQLLAASDIGIVTLEKGMEGLCVPSKLYSIMAAGRPILGLVDPRTETARTLVEDGCGWVADTGSPEEIARILREAAQNLEDSACRGQKARRALVEKHSSEKCAQKLDEVLRS